MAKSHPFPVKAARSPPRAQTKPSRGHTRRPFPVVAIGASAGGLDACRKFLNALPADCGMAFILVQHLDPAHESMMVDLLAGHTSMAVQQAADGMLVEQDHLYVIPPGTYLSLAGGTLHLTKPQARHGARLPFDFLLHSLAEDCGSRAVCVVLSGTGTDGSLGLRAVKEKHGLVIAQDPDEAGYDGMPRSAIATGAVDLVLGVAKIPGALIKYRERGIPADGAIDPARGDPAQDCLSQIIDLLRTKTVHDFALYKPGTLRRRIEQRMATATIACKDMSQYLTVLQADDSELDLLAKDLLINVTSFFRDAKVFDVLAQQIIPDLVRNHPSAHPIRIWVAGCSTGEEAYSLAMLFHEQIAATGCGIKVQIFASDVDADAVAQAREGLYPETIEADIAPERLARFFSKEDHSYRVSPELRAMVVFTVQDVLADPPFSRIDLVSCRNLLIYLASEAQAKVISVFHFALRQGGLLVLGNSETAGNVEGLFEFVSKPARIYRHIGCGRPGELGFFIGNADGVRVPVRPGQSQTLSRQAAFGDLCRQRVLETHAPATILVNRKHELLFSLGPIERYLQVAPGAPTHNVLAMAHPGLRIKLRSATQQAFQKKQRVVIPGGQTEHKGHTLLFDIDIEPVQSEGEDLLLICFLDRPRQTQEARRPATHEDMSRVAELEQELAATRTELQGAIRSLEVSSEEQKSINDEAMSINEEYQSTNEELLTSKEELQSLNEELTALNTQLQETLERQRITSNDLQNILFSTNVATLFLDPDLRIRFFTPATKSLFSIIPADIGRPLADLHSLAIDSALLDDAKTVLRTHALIECEVEAQSGVWFSRRIFPYRTDDNKVEGVVITFSDITERRRIAAVLEVARRQTELASVAKSRFLATASHDLRQPLQTLTLLQGLLSKIVEGERAQKLLVRVDETLAAMTGMLNALLDINQIEAGTVHAEIVDFPIDDLMNRLRDEFNYHAQAQGLSFRSVSCGLTIRSDPRLLEQMIRNLLSNALKYTKHGKILLGCRRRGGMLGIEIWDTGIGIAATELQAIFDEYHQLDNAARERSRGLGLGLSIVQRLGDLLDHRIRVASQPGKGSVFAIEVPLAQEALGPRSDGQRQDIDHAAAKISHPTGAILVIEDDPEIRDLLEVLLKGEGHHTTMAADGVAALELVDHGTIRPDLILSDFNLPNDMDGLYLVSKLRELLHSEIPVIILTGDISTGTLRDIELQNCVQLNKPVKVKDLMQTIQRLLPAPAPLPHLRVPRGGEAVDNAPPPIVFVVDDDSHIRKGIREVLEQEGWAVEDYVSCEAFLEDYRPGGQACLLIDAYLPGMSGLELLQQLGEAGHQLPAIMITGNSDVAMAVQAMKAGASDFIEKPVARGELLAGIERALEQSRDSNKLFAWREAAANHVAGLTSRQREIMDLVLAGHPSKNIAADLGISQRTVENHRAAIMRKMGAKSLPELARLALAAVWNDAEKPFA